MYAEFCLVVFSLLPLFIVCLFCAWWSASVLLFCSNFVFIMVAMHSDGATGRLWDTQMYLMPGSFRAPAAPLRIGDSPSRDALVIASKCALCGCCSLIPYCYIFAHGNVLNLFSLANVLFRLPAVTVLACLFVVFRVSSVERHRGSVFFVDARRDCTAVVDIGPTLCVLIPSSAYILQLRADSACFFV